MVCVNNLTFVICWDHFTTAMKYNWGNSSVYLKCSKNWPDRNSHTPFVYKNDSSKCFFLIIFLFCVFNFIAEDASVSYLKEMGAISSPKRCSIVIEFIWTRNQYTSNRCKTKWMKTNYKNSFILDERRKVAKLTLKCNRLVDLNKTKT